MYYSVHTKQAEECPLDVHRDCGRSSCEGCASNGPVDVEEDDCES